MTSENQCSMEKLKTPMPSPPAPGSATANNLAWAMRELKKMQDEEHDPRLRALWRRAAGLARERIASKSPNSSNGTNSL
jgi:hypothetical protein